MFESSKLKVERAKKHVLDLQGVFDAFVASNPHSLGFQTDQNTGTLCVRVRFKVEPPKELPLIIGDAIHNLRCALDHVTWEIMGLDRGTQDRYTKFPTAPTAQDYRATCLGMKTKRLDTKQFFIGLAAYEGGNGHAFWGINESDNADKHNVSAPILSASSVFIESANIIGPNGVHVSTIQAVHNAATPGPDGSAIVLVVGRGLTVEFDRQPQATPTIVFRKIDPFPLRPVIPTLMQVTNSVSNLLGEAEKFVTSRPATS